MLMQIALFFSLKTSAMTKISASDLEKQMQQQPTLDPVMMGIMEEVRIVGVKYRVKLPFN